MTKPTTEGNEEMRNTRLRKVWRKGHTPVETDNLRRLPRKSERNHADITWIKIKLRE